MQILQILSGLKSEGCTFLNAFNSVKLYIPTGKRSEFRSAPWPQLRFRLKHFTRSENFAFCSFSKIFLSLLVKTKKQPNSMIFANSYAQEICYEKITRILLSNKNILCTWRFDQIPKVSFVKFYSFFASKPFQGEVQK